MPQIQHVVHIKIKPKVKAEKIIELFSQLAQLQQLIPGITYACWWAVLQPRGTEVRVTRTDF